MKPKSPPPVASKAKQLPKPRLMYSHTYVKDPVFGPCRTSFWDKPAAHRTDDLAFLVLPQSSASSARARLRFERITDEQKVIAIAKTAAKSLLLKWSEVTPECREPFYAEARAIMALVTGRAKK